MHYWRAVGAMAQHDYGCCLAHQKDVFSPKGGRAKSTRPMWRMATGDRAGWRSPYTGLARAGECWDRWRGEVVGRAPSGCGAFARRHAPALEEGRAAGAPCHDGEARHALTEPLPSRACRHL